MKVYYKITHVGAGFTTVKFWTKDDASDAISDRFVRVTDETLTKYYENTTGRKKFTLVRVV